MTMSVDMNVCLRLPTQVLYQGTALKLFAVAENGAFEILPNHIDFVTSLVPSVLILALVDGSEKIIGIDEGILVKKGNQIEIAIQRGVLGKDLDSLQQNVQTRFIEVDEDERTARSALSRLEAGMVRQFAELQRPIS